METQTPPPGIVFKKDRCLETDGIRIQITQARGFEVSTDCRGDSPRVLTVELWRAGLLMKQSVFNSFGTYLDSVIGWNPAEFGVRVLDATGAVIAVLDVEEDPYPFMQPRAEQVHITESYVSVPPALTITDEGNNVWTLGMTIAPKHKSPDGEFAFPVLKNGIDTLEIASRIERRGGKIKIFTCEGWKVWTGSSFF